MLAIFIGLQWAVASSYSSLVSRLDRPAYGNAGDAAPVGEMISELRIHYGPGYRINYHRQGNIVVILLCDGGKTSQATDIKTAKRLLDEWTKWRVG
jgi:putative addiction module killer protein